MPGTDGFELTARLRTLVPPELPLLAWTVKDLSRADRTRLKSAAVALVGKDASGADSLVDALRSIVRRRSS